VDLRMRAEGSVGQLARSLDDYKKYYSTRGVVWERLALLSLAMVAAPWRWGWVFEDGSRLSLAAKKRSIFPRAGDCAGCAGVKEMIDAKMADRGHERRNELGIGDQEIEFLVQTVQVIAGKKVTVCGPEHARALNRFVRYKLISTQERDDLAAAYVFLRDVEHKLQMVQDFQTHALPDSSRRTRTLRHPRRAMTRTTVPKASRFRADHERHTGLVNRFFRTFYYDAKTSPVFKATIRMISAKR
jgi:glutamate-ammonia-ligase adenylyltransferase